MSLGPLPRIARTASFGLALFYALLFAASAAILGTIFYWTILSSLERQMTTRIEAEIALLREELRSEGTAELIEEVLRRNRTLAFEYLLVDAQGNRVTGNLPGTSLPLGWSDIQDSTTVAGDQRPRTFRVHTVRLDNGMRLSVADDFGSIEDLRYAWLEACSWGLLGFLVLSLVGGLLLSQGFLKRVDAIRHTAEAIISGDLGSRIPLRGTNDNFDLLSHTLNQMMDRIEALMENSNQVSNDIAHALRTPLSRLQQKLEAARSAARGNAGCENAIDLARIETEKILETFSALLRISEIEVGARHSGFRDLDLSALFKTVCEAYEPVAEDEGKSIAANIAPSSMALGDKELLTEMLANLLDNAIRHTPRGSHIAVSLAHDDSQIVASVADNGLGVPYDARDRIFQRFYRLEQSARIQGSGLGLPLVAAVAGLHNVQLSVEDNSPGLRVTMRFKSAHKSKGIKTRTRLLSVTP